MDFVYYLPDLSIHSRNFRDRLSEHAFSQLPNLYVKHQETKMIWCNQHETQL